MSTTMSMSNVPPVAARAASGGPNPDRFGEPVLELRDVHKSFGETKIIRGANLTVKRGQRHALIGPNGAGKSTLFNLISGHYVPTSGDIVLNGKSISGLGSCSMTSAASCVLVASDSRGISLVTTPWES